MRHLVAQTKSKQSDSPTRQVSSCTDPQDDLGAEMCKLPSSKYVNTAYSQPVLPCTNTSSDSSRPFGRS